MPLVTAITALPRHPGRVAVDVDGIKVAVLDIETVCEHQIAIGRELDIPALEALTNADNRRRTLDRAVELLATRARSVRELRRRLLQAREPEEQVDAAINHLTAIGALDDEDYACQLVRSQMLGRGYAPRRLRQELARRGVARDIADRAIATVVSDHTVSGVDRDPVGASLAKNIERLARKKLALMSNLDPAIRSRRLYSFLARRGYDNNAIREVLKLVGAV